MVFIVHSISAAQHCQLLAYAGKDDWNLPSPNELDDIYLNKADVDATAILNGGEIFEDDWYWSSAGLSHTNARH